jgi:hypothetical protein
MFIRDNGFQSKPHCTLSKDEDGSEEDWGRSMVLYFNLPEGLINNHNILHITSQAWTFDKEDGQSQATKLL